MSEAINMYYKGIRSAMRYMNKEEVISGLDRVQNKLNEIKDALNAKEDFQSTCTALNEDEKIRAFENLSNETRALWYVYNEMKRETEELPFFLYTNSTHKDVRKEMLSTVDKFIRVLFKNRGASTKRECHDLLYLSTFGGKITQGRPNTARIAYEFNVRNGDRYIPAASNGLMKDLFAKGLTKDHRNQTTENNLTYIGIAVLARLDERLGSSNASKTFTQKVFSKPPTPR